MQPSAIAVLGAGSYGTALAICLARNGNVISLWGRNAQDMAQMAAQRVNQKYLPDIPLPDTLQITSDLAEAIASSRDILLVVPSHFHSTRLSTFCPPTADLYVNSTMTNLLQILVCWLLVWQLLVP